MTIALASVVSPPLSGRGTTIVLDHQQYAQAVILRGQPIPWSDPATYANFYGQAQLLLRPDAALLDLGAFYDSQLADDEDLRIAMKARSRIGYALKSLLADEKTADLAFELASVVSQT